jgi:uncharacterized membrane protein YidH (DUF202 family)
MTRYAVPSIIVAILVLALALITIVLGLNLLPSRLESIERGTYAPWMIVWAMIALTVLCAVLLAIPLFMNGVRGLSSGTHART